MFQYTSDFVPTQSGDWELGLVSVDQAKLFVNGELAIDYSRDLEPGTFWFSFCHKEKKAILSGLKAGTAYRLELRCWSTGKFDLLPVIIPATFQIGAIPAISSESEAIRIAVEKSSKADVTILVVGLTADYETEGADQKDMT
jgi:beta-glucosidase